MIKIQSTVCTLFFSKAIYAATDVYANCDLLVLLNMFFTFFHFSTRGYDLFDLMCVCIALVKVHL